MKALRGLLRHALIDVPAFWRYDPRTLFISASSASSLHSTVRRSGFRGVVRVWRPGRTATAFACAEVEPHDLHVCDERTA